MGKQRCTWVHACRMDMAMFICTLMRLVAFSGSACDVCRGLRGAGRTHYPPASLHGVQARYVQNFIACTCTRMHVRMHEGTSACTHVHPCTLACVRARTYVHMCLHTHLWMHALMHSYVHAHMHGGTHGHTHGRTHAHARSHALTRTHSHTRTRALTCSTHARMHAHTHG